MPRTRSLAWSELKIGVLAVAALVLTAILVMAVGGASGFSWQRYEIKWKRFRDTPRRESDSRICPRRHYHSYRVISLGFFLWQKTGGKRPLHVTARRQMLA